ncbi:DUF2750 domain-containing protein [Bacillus sp. FJAT-52991]|uniref:DUF2750 domain-containing protein n=1 Tax=Bacillus kandeliae TaxID=3129297 RepID=A0ABZ2NBF2_9BACI
MKKTWDDIVRNNRELDEMVPKGFIAIAGNGTYNKIGYMYAKGYQVGAIYYWNHETGALLLESPSLSKWINEMNKTGEARIAQFIEEVKSTEIVYGLIDGVGGGMAYAISNEDEDTDVMLFWASQTLANKCKEDEWRDYKILAMSLQDFLKKWVPGMHKDELLCGLNWGRDLTGEELEPMNLYSLLKK